MTGRPFAIAAAVGIWIAAPVTAEPPQKPAQANPPAEQQTAAMLAASDLKVPASAKDAPSTAAPKPKRHARVTSCRCADVSDASAPQN